jgi:uncharacterized membrane protein
MRADAQIDVSAPPDVVWEWITNPSRALHYMSGITRFEVLSDEPRGLGARYRTSMRVGSAEIGGIVEVVEFQPPRDMAWHSVTGLDQRVRFRLRELPHGRTHVEFRLAYGVAGSGLGGWLAERVAAPTVRGHLRRSLHQLKRQVEQEQLRALQQARRSARTASAG